MSNNTPVGELIAAASAGDAEAWRALVDRHVGLVLSVCRQFRLSEQDAQDVAQTVWLRLVERLDTVREPQALPGWLVKTTRNECIGVWRTARRQIPTAPTTAFALWDDVDATPPDQGLLEAERHQALREAFGQLPGHCRRLLARLFADPPMPYDEVGRELGVSKGYIGPTRARCLDKLRDCPALVAYLSLESEVLTKGGETHATAMVDG
jgi:RNA polymerase sigma factor (sigma-70 family)